MASTYDSTRRQNPEEHHHLHSRENLEFHNVQVAHFPLISNAVLINIFISTHL
jgi:hypothetical protein